MSGRCLGTGRRWEDNIRRDLNEIVRVDKHIFEHFSEEDRCQHFVGTIMKHQDIP